MFCDCRIYPFGTYFNWSYLTFCPASSKHYQPCFTRKLGLATNIPGFTSLVAPLLADVPLLDVVPLFAACETPCCPEVIATSRGMSISTKAKLEAIDHLLPMAIFQPKILASKGVQEFRDSEVAAAAVATNQASEIDKAWNLVSLYHDHHLRTVKSGWGLWCNIGMAIGCQFPKLNKCHLDSFGPRAIFNKKIKKHL